MELVDSLPFADIFTSRPYIFASTALRRIRKSCWAAWVAGPGYEQHAEYELATTEKATAEHFRWDRVALTRNLTASTFFREVFILENDQFCYRVDRKYYMGHDVNDYYLMKQDKKKDITFTLYLACESHYDIKHIFAGYNITTPHLRVCHDNILTFFSWYYDLFYVSKQSLSLLLPVYSTDWIPITNHNIKSIIDFMKTSCLDLSANMPTYIAAR